MATKDNKKTTAPAQTTKPKKPRKARDPNAPPVDHREAIEGRIKRPLRDLKRLARDLERANIALDVVEPLRAIHATLAQVVGDEGASLIAQLPPQVTFARKAVSHAIEVGHLVRAKPASSEAYRMLGESIRVVGFTKLGALLLEGVDEPVPADSFLRVEFYKQALSRLGKRGPKSK